MFSFAMTSGMASDSDKFEIIKTLSQTQKCGDTGPYKNFILYFYCDTQQVWFLKTEEGTSTNPDFPSEKKFNKLQYSNI